MKCFLTCNKAIIVITEKNIKYKIIIQSKNEANNSRHGLALTQKIYSLG